MPVFVTPCLSLLHGACLCYTVSVIVMQCLSLLRSACPCWPVHVFVTLCVSLLSCACLCCAVPVFVTLSLSLLRCSCLYYAVRVLVELCLSLLSCVCHSYTASNRILLCWPFCGPMLFGNRILTLILVYMSALTTTPYPLPKSFNEIYVYTFYKVIKLGQKTVTCMQNQLQKAKVLLYRFSF